MDIVCMGILVADVVAGPIDIFPRKGTLGLVKDLGLYSGGCAANTGVDLAKLGIKTGIIGKIGNDGFGSFLMDEMKKSGLDTEGVRIDNKMKTSSTMVYVSSDGERTFVHYFGANAKLTDTDVDRVYVKKAKIFHVAGFYLLPALEGKPLMNVLKKAKENGVITSLDTAWDSRGRWLKAINLALPYIDYFFTNLEEGQMISGKKNIEAISSFFLDKGVKTVLIKMGSRGSFLKTEKTSMNFKPFKIKPVDGTGSGDAFVAGFLAGLIKKWPLEKCAKFANATGAIATTEMGATQGIKDFKHTLAFMKNAPSKE